MDKNKYLEFFRDYAHSDYTHESVLAKEFDSYTNEFHIDRLNFAHFFWCLRRNRHCLYMSSSLLYEVFKRLES